jgi:hypothetical protein
LPQTLADLTPTFLPAIPADPFDGSPLRFRRLERGFVVYSVAADGQDDEGREKPLEAKPGDATRYDMSFTLER